MSQTLASRHRMPTPSRAVEGALSIVCKQAIIEPAFRVQPGQQVKTAPVDGIPRYRRHFQVNPSLLEYMKQSV